MDFSGFGGSTNETIDDHVCEIIVVDFKSKKAVYRCESVNGEIGKKDQKNMDAAIAQLKEAEEVKKSA